MGTVLKLVLTQPRERPRPTPTLILEESFTLHELLAFFKQVQSLQYTSTPSVIIDAPDTVLLMIQPWLRARRIKVERTTSVAVLE